MNRRVWLSACASVIASAGLAQAQTPPAATDGAGVVTLRSAGQPDRRLQVLKSERMPDGKILNEVKDLTTGQVFTIVDTKPFAGTEPKPALPVMTPATQPVQQVQQTTLPGTTVPASNLPGARPRTADPLMPGASVPASAATTTRPATRYENSGTPQTEYPTLVGKLRGNGTQQQVQPPVQPQTPGKQSAISQALFGSYDQPAAPATPLIGNSAARTKPVTMPEQTPVQTTSTGGIKNALFGTPAQAPVENPTLMGKLFGDKPTTTTTSTTVVQTPTQPRTGIIRPNAIASNNARIMTPVTPTVGVTPPAMEPRMTPVAVAAPVMPAAPAAPAAVQAASYTPVSTDSRDPNFHVKPAQPMTMKQIEEQVKELRMNQRPSKRMDAATALASGPMAGMVEVRQILAEATYRDPVGVVRAHCIELLTKLKYDEYNYKQYVETLVNDDEPAVQRAARAAVK